MESRAFDTDEKSNWDEPKVMFWWERFEKVKIKNLWSDKWVDQLVEYLHAYVKIFGEIKIHSPNR